jgi:hypothetical protein
MRGRFGCWSVVWVTGLAALFPPLYHLARSAGKQPAPPAADRRAARAAVCLEGWVRLRSYRGCPVLAAAGGYRLGLFCWAARSSSCSGAGRPGSPGRPGSSGWPASNGALVFTGPFPGRAYISERPVPLGRWVHLAGIEGGAGSTPPAAAGTRAPPALIAIGGVEVTAGRLFGQGDPLPLGYDLWEKLCASRHLPGPPDGETGAWRLSRGWRSLREVAAGRGTPWRLTPLPPPAAPQPQAAAAASHPPGGFTRRGLAILGSGLLLALAMVGAGLALRSRVAGEGAGEDRRERLRK